MKCWTCGHAVQGHTYNCGYCRQIDQLKALRSDAENGIRELRHQHSSTSKGLSELAQVQREGFAQLSGAVSEGLSNISAALTWGFEDLRWELEQQNDTLRGIDQTLRAPSATKANEWRLMAEELRRRGTLADAEEFFRKAIAANPLDFRLYVGLAHTYLQSGRFLDARHFLERSLPHAPRNEIDYRSLSLRLIGHVEECEEDYAAAAKTLHQAVELSPSYHEARYEYAQYAAQAGDVVGAMVALEAAIDAEPEYWYRSEREPNFASCRDDVEQLRHRIFQSVRRDAARLRKVVHDGIGTAREWLGYSTELWRSFRMRPHAIGPPESAAQISKAAEMLAEADKVIKSGDYRQLLSVLPRLLEVGDVVIAATNSDKEKSDQYLGVVRKRQENLKKWSLRVGLYFLAFILGGGALSGVTGETVVEGMVRGLGAALAVPLIVIFFMALDN